MAEESLLGGKSPLDALKEWWGERKALRRTYGDANLTRAIIVCNLLESDYGFTGMKALADQLMEGRAGERGWDTDMMLKAIEAASEKAFVIPNQRKEE
jgi:hypothetical protein